MKLFDLHADIGYDVLAKHQQGFQNVIDTQHAPKCLQGEVEIIGMASFFSGVETWKDMQTMILTLESEIHHSSIFHHVLSPQDFLVEKPLALMSVEGMCGIEDHEVECIDWLYDHGVRLASLNWNEQNELSTGVKGDPHRGLTEKGKKVIKRMDELHMIIDVSHANEKSFWDILSCSTGLVIATHSNSQSLCSHPRNLSDQQAIALAKRGGLIGMNACAYFVDDDLNQVTISRFAQHAAYLKELVGIDALACGFDYMDFFEDETLDVIPGLENASQSQRFVEALKEVGFNEEEIEKICYKNAVEKFKAYL